MRGLLRHDGIIVRSGGAWDSLGFLGSVAPTRAFTERSASAASDLNNVVPFAPRRRAEQEAQAPVLTLNLAEVRATARAPRQNAIALLLAGSFAAHAGLMAYFMREPQPMASIGIEAISVELVLGAETAAGIAQTPSVTEVASAPSPDVEKVDDVRTETAKREPDRIVEPMTKPTESEKVETPKDVAALSEPAKPLEAEPIAQPIAAEPAPAPPAPEAVQAPPAKPEPVAAIAIPAPPKTEAAPKPDTKKESREPAPREKKPAARDGKDRRDRVAPAAIASAPSSGVGVGRSALDSNYRGLVAAHLARQKQYPADARARGEQGTASVTFGLAGSGSVTSVRLSHATGIASIDQETVAMVRRASPFPAPPDGRPQTFTVPVTFNIR